MTQATLDRITDETTAQDSAGARLFERAQCLRLEFRNWGTSKKVDPRSITTDADRALLKVGKEIIESDRLEIIAAQDGELRRWVVARSVPLATARLFKGGVHLVSLANFEEVNERVQDYAERIRPALVNDFLAYDYQAGQKMAARKLGTLYDASDYPDARTIRQAFSVYAQWFEFGAPRALATIDGERYRREQARIAAEFDTVLAGARGALREEFADLLARLADAVTAGPDGKVKRFRDTTVDGLKQWIELVKGRDLTNDAALQQLTARAEALLSGVAADDLRGTGYGAVKVREALAAKLADIKADAGALVELAPSRAYGDDV